MEKGETMSFLHGFNQVIQSNSFLFFFVFFSLVIFLQSFLRENIALRKDCRLVKVYYYGTIFFPLLVSTLFLSLIFSFKSNFFGFSDSFNVLIFIVILFEILCLFYINNWLSKKYPELKEKISILFFFGRFSFSIVLTLFSKFLLTKELAESKIEQIALVLKNKVNNFEEIFVNSVDKEGFLVAESIQNSVSNILSLSIKISELNSWDLSATFLYFSIFCPFYTVFFVLVTGNLNSLSEIYSSIKKNHEPEIASYMFPASKKVSQEIIPFSEQKKFNNLIKMRSFHRSKDAFGAIIKKTNVKSIITDDDLILSNVFHSAVNLSKDQASFIKESEAIMTKISKESRIIGQQKKSMWIKPKFTKLNKFFYVSGKELKLSNPHEVTRDEFIVEKQEVIHFRRDVGILLNRNINSLIASLFVRDQNCQLLGFNGYERDEFIINKFNAIANILFIDEFKRNALLKELIRSFFDPDQSKGYQLETRKKVLPQYLAAHYLSKYHNWVLESHPKRGQGDYRILDTITGLEKLLEIKIPSQKMDLGSFSKWLCSEADKIMYKSEIQNIKTPLILGVVLPFGIEGLSAEELTILSQKIFLERIGEEVIELKIITLI